MKILLLGSQGQVGAELCKTLPAMGELTAWNRRDIDLTQLDQIVPKVVEQHPDVIVNAAAYTAVDQAERESDLAYIINAKVPTQLATASQVCGATLIHISTDYVFDGHKNRPYLTTDNPCPLGVYGQSKRAGEIAVLEGCDRPVILRTAWVYGASGKGNFVKTMLRLGAEREILNVVYDQVGSPTWAYDIAQAIAALMSRLDTSSFGIYHFTNSGVVSWYDFAIAIFEEARALHHSLNIHHVNAITSDQYPTAAERPAYSVLAGDKLAKLLNQTAPYWRYSLRNMLKELLTPLTAVNKV